MTHDFQDYERFPIQINPNTVMMIELYHLDNCIAHCIDCDCPNKINADLDSHVKAADQFIKQLEGHWTELFLTALRDRINEELKDCHNKYRKNYE